jgi:hypothetical protein
MTRRAHPRARRFCRSTVALLALLATGGADQAPVNTTQASTDHNSVWRPPSAAVTVGPISERPLSHDDATAATAGPVPTSWSGIPRTALSAYTRAADAQQRDDPTCHLTWPVLAAIGKVESNHADDGDVTTSGDLVHPIFGPILDGRSGTAAVLADNNPDHTGQWSRAEGPMQVLPTTWAKWAADGNGDGRTDVQNVYDASLAAAHYLCSGNTDLATGPGLSDAILRYNPSATYLETVTYWLYVYGHGTTAIPDQVSTSGISEDTAAEQSPHSAPTPPARASSPPPAQPVQQRPAPSPAPPPSLVPIVGQQLVQPVTQLLNNVVRPITGDIS